MVEFYVYESWVAGPSQGCRASGELWAVQRRQQGRPAGHDANHARWHGPIGHAGRKPVN